MNVQARVRLLEVLSALTIITSLSAIAVPKYADLKRRDIAAQVLTDVEVVRTAVYGFYSDSAYFPEESPTGELPETLTEYLPRLFSVRRSYGTIEYKNWPVRTAHDRVPASNVVGVTVSTRDPRIGATAMMLSHRTARFAVENKYTFLFFGG